MADRSEMIKDIEELLSLHDLRMEEWEKVKMEKEHDFTSVLEKTQKRIDELTAKAEKYAKETGMNPAQLEEYLTKRANFNPKEWEMIQTTKKKCDEIQLQTEEILRNSEFLGVKKDKHPLEEQKKVRKRIPPEQRKGWKEV